MIGKFIEFIQLSIFNIFTFIFNVFNVNQEKREAIYMITILYMLMFINLNILTLIKFIFALLYKNELQNNIDFIDPYNWFLLFVRYELIESIFLVPFFVSDCVPDAELMVKMILSEENYARFMRYYEIVPVYLNCAMFLQILWLVYGFTIFWQGTFSLIVNVFYYSYYLFQLGSLLYIMYNWRNDKKYI